MIGYDKPSSGSFNTETPLFNHVEVTKNSTNNNWGYTDTKYWQRNTTYRFAAYANGSSDNSKMVNVSYDPTDSIDKLTVTDYTPNDCDLVASISGDKVVDETIPSDRVAFSFHHMLSRVKISFKLGTAFSSIAKISNVRIVNAIKKGTGTCNYISNSHPAIVWSGTVETENAYVLSSEAITLSTAFHELETFVIPQSADSIKLKFKFETYEDANSTEAIHSYDKVANLTIPNITDNFWKNSYVYNYVCSFGEELDETPIEFTVYSVEGWNPANESAIILNPTNDTTN